MNDTNNFDQKSNEQTPFFDEVGNVDAFIQPDFPVPEEADAIVSHWEQNKVLILKAPADLALDDFSKVLAAQLRQLLNINLPVKEWRISSDQQERTIISTLKNESQTSIYLFNHQHPLSIDYDVSGLVDAAAKLDSYVLITTDSLMDWKIANTAFDRYGLELTAVRYHASDLEQFLATLIIRYDSVLLSRKNVFIRKKLLQLDVQTKIAKTLSTPAAIQFFLQLLIHQREELSEQDFWDKLKEVEQSNAANLSKQIFNCLDEWEKFVVFGIMFFDGLFVDQFFVGMTVLANEHWGVRHQQLISLDYCDLQRLNHFYSITEDRYGRQILQLKYPELRRELLKNSWNDLRRHLLGVLPVFTELLIQSKKDKTGRWELFDSLIKQQRFRLRIGEVLSDFGLLHLASVQEFLLRLAAQDNAVLRRVAAKSIARWRQSGNPEHEKQLFDLLENWKNDRQFINLFKTLLEQQGLKTKDNNSGNYIDTTIVNTLGYAATYDAINQLSEQIIKLFSVYIHHPRGKVSTEVKNTIPFLLHHHAGQLYDNGFLVKLLDKEHLVSAVGYGLYRSLATYPTTTYNLIALIENKYQSSNDYVPTTEKQVTAQGCLWGLFSFVKNNLPNDTPSDKRGNAQRIAESLVYLCFHAIKHHGINERIMRDTTALDWLENTLKRPIHPTIRKTIIDALVNLLEKEPTRIGSILLNTNSEEYENYIVKELFFRYLKEREKLTGGDRKMKYRDKKFFIWYNKDMRPLTVVEKLLNNLLYNGTERQKELALSVLTLICEEFDVYEEQYIIKKLAEAEEKAQEQIAEDRIVLRTNFNPKSWLRNKVRKTKENIQDKMSFEGGLKMLDSEKKYWLMIYTYLRNWDGDILAKEMFIERLQRQMDVPNKIRNHLKSLI